MQDRLNRDRLKEYAAIQRLLVIPERYIEILFTVTLLAFVGLFLWMAPDYGRYGRLIPLLIGVPTFAFLAVTTLGLLSTRFGRFLNRFKLNDILDMSGSVSQFADDTNESQPLSVQRLQMLVISGWILLLTALFVNVGIKEAIAVFLLGYYRFQAGLSIGRTVAYSVVIWGFIYAVFEILLGTPL
ncbi:hypothetical protein [Natrinema soli]|uniref:Yip1 domain-containing protein n=1 Tax=Natrinema soli TaxID=1930624 RepID=A0ABD5SMG0_9EURY|nr:hypothetical protein [Natrinema soli]